MTPKYLVFGCHIKGVLRFFRKIIIKFGKVILSRYDK